MPIKYILTTFSKPIPFSLTPQVINKTTDTSFYLIIFVEILMCSQQPFEHESRLYQIGTIIFPAERNGFSVLPIYPMRPNAMVTVRILIIQKADYFQHTLCRLFTRYKSTFCTDNNSHYPKAGTTNGNNIVITVTTFACQARNRMSIIPEITESLFLHEGHQFFIRQVLLLLTTRSCRQQAKRGKQKHHIYYKSHHIFYLSV